MKRFLGLDLGINSLGWASVAFENDRPVQIHQLGVRIFEAGVENLEKDGKGTPRNTQRRDARQIRRQTERRARRRHKLFHALQLNGLLPRLENGIGMKAGVLRHTVLEELDRRLLLEYKESEASERFFHMLRSRALDHPLGAFAIGRVLYHLAQHRGFLSNRKTDRKDSEHSNVLDAIRELDANLKSGNSRTLGEYLYHADPGERLRCRWTSRAMYLQEFDAIWEAQQQHHAELLTDNLRGQIHEIIFYQRPLKSQRHLIGRCELEPNKHRCAWGVLAAQRFRYLQRLNDLELTDTETGEIITLDDAQRTLFLNHLEHKGDLSFNRMRQLLKNRGLEFNLELGGDKGIPGNRTMSRLLKIDPTLLQRLEPEDLDRLVDDLLCIEQEEAIERRAVEHWGFADEEARQLSALSLEPGHCHFSRKAILKLLPQLGEGVPLNTVIKDCYPDQFSSGTAVDALPPVLQAFPTLRNPVVARSLTQLRLVVNSYVRKHGLPDKIRIEMARDLKQSPKHREESLKRNRAREKERQLAVERLLKEAGIQQPTRSDIERVLLAEECEFCCPYTGRRFGMAELFNGKMDVEHIIPRSRSLDNSFANKTLCWAEENRRKGRRTPFEAYADEGGTWQEIQDRVSRFKGGFRNAKLRRFRMTSEEVEQLLDEFAQSQLRDTAYANKLAGQYLGMLYGGEVDEDGTRRVEKVAGRATALLRAAWGLNEVLKAGPGKSRDDHRHHVVDALVVAVSTPSHVKQLSLALQRSEDTGERIAGKIDEPWPMFQMQAGDQIRQVVPSHKVNRRIRGALHNESNFSGTRDNHGRPTPGGPYVHIRKPVESLKQSQLKDVVDPVIRRLLGEAFTLHGSAWQKDAAKFPRIVDKHGRERPLRHVRLRKKSRVTQVGRDHRSRFVETGGNHHLAVFEVTDAKGRMRWEADLVSSFEASRRLLAGEPVVRREREGGGRFLFTLQQGDCFTLAGDPECKGVQIVRSLDNYVGGLRIWFVSNSDARKLTEVRADKSSAGKFKARGINVLSKRGFVKIHIGLLGEVSSHGTDS